MLNNGMALRTGFTLIETMVAITIMTLATLAPFAAVQQVIRATSLSRDQLIASSLAQEAIEYVRFVRYTNWLQTEGQGLGGYVPLRGLNGTNGPNCTAGRLCTVDARVAPYAGGILQGVDACGAPSQSACTKLHITPEGLYTQSATGNTPTVYTRSLTVSDTSASGYVTVSVTVSWENRGAYSITLTEELYDWL